MTDEELRNYLGMLSFLLAGLSFLAGERREAIARLHERGDVTCAEKWLAVGSVALLCLAALALGISAWPAVHSTGFGLHDLVRLNTVIEQAFITGWLLLMAVTLALFALVLRALRIEA